MSESVTFKAAFPAIQSAIKVYGDKQGMRVQLDIPESEMSAALSLLLWRECVLEITVSPAMGAPVEEDEALKYRAEQGDGTEQDNLGPRAKRKSRWASA